MNYAQQAIALQRAQLLIESYAAMDAYTALPMIDYLRKVFNLSFGELLEAPKLLAERFDKSVFESREMQHSLRMFWVKQSGRCTAFAIRIASGLEMQYPDMFQFKIYDVGHHRLARCQRTGVVLDSSRISGAFLVEEGIPVADAKGYHWKYSDGMSGYRSERRRGRPAPPDLPISKTDAIINCLKEVAVDLSAVTMFRSFSDHVEYHGMIKWDIKKKQLRFIPDMEKSHRAYVVQWSGGAPVQYHDNLELFYDLLIWFIHTHGGPHGMRQWASPGVSGTHDVWCQYALCYWGAMTIEPARGMPWPPYLRL